MTANEFEPKIPPTKQELDRVAGDVEKELMAKEASDHIDSAETEFSAEKAEDHAKIVELNESIASHANEMPVEQQHSEKEGTSFVVPSPPGKKAGFWKKAAVFGGMAIGLFAGKNADAQQKAGTDKAPVTKETTVQKPKYTRVELTPQEVREYSEAFHSLNQKNMDDWNDYIYHLRDLDLAGSPKLNSKQFSDSMMDEWIAKNPGTTLSHDIVTKVQKGLIYYENTLNLAEKEAEKKGNVLVIGGKLGQANTIMEGLKHTKADGFLGQYTSSYLFPKATMHTEEKMIIRGEVDGRLHTEVTLKPTKKVEHLGYVDPDKLDLRNN